MLAAIKFRPIERATLELLLAAHQAEGADPVAAYGRLMSSAMVAGAIIGLTPATDRPAGRSLRRAGAARRHRARRHLRRLPRGDGLMADLPYVYRWNRQGRKGQPCRVLARSRVIRPTSSPALAFGAPRQPRFNSIRIEFADGFSMVTSGNAIRRAK